ncbi:hypothetical protein NQZ68_024725 [Dissostichus eleginoides]|nr:hypothetical protein NQZ68_024725 [Dissostichus eleginoides]
MYGQSKRALHRLQDGENTSGLSPDSPLNSLRLSAGGVSQPSSEGPLPPPPAAVDPFKPHRAELLGTNSLRTNQFVSVSHH